MAERKKQHWARALSDAINLVTTIAFAIGLCGVGGWWLDNRYGTNPKFTVIGVLLGMATAIKVLWDQMMADQKKASKDKGSEQ